MMILRIAPAAAIGAALVVGQPCFAADDATAEAERIEREELELNDNPTILRRRVWWENEYSDRHQGAWQSKLTLGGVYAFSLSPDHEWAVRLKLPLVFANGGRVAGVDNEAGLGDIEFAFATARRLAPTFRAACGLETKFNTATADALGDGTAQLKPFLAFSWDAARWLTLAPNSKGKVDFEQDSEYLNTLKIGTGKVLTEWTQMYASVEVPLEATSANFRVTVGMNFFFN
jgi:hypothetical protein